MRLCACVLECLCACAPVRLSARVRVLRLRAWAAVRVLEATALIETKSQEITDNLEWNDEAVATQEEATKIDWNVGPDNLANMQVPSRDVSLPIRTRRTPPACTTTAIAVAPESKDNKRVNRDQKQRDSGQP